MTSVLQIFTGKKESEAEIRNDFLQKLGKSQGSMNIDLELNQNKIRQRKQDKRVLNEGGNFEVQVHIQELRDLVGVDWGETSDPVVTVTIMDQKKSTKKIEDKTNITLNQILFFSLKALEPRQLLRTKCVVHVFDHNLIFPNKMIGSFEFNLGSIYYKKHHEIYNQWVALSNYDTYEQNNYDTDDTDAKYDDSDDNKQDNQDRVRADGIQGSLKLSIRVLSPNDEPHTHTKDEEADTRSNGLVLLPPSITQTPWKLTVRIYAFKHFPRLDEDPMAFIERFRHNYDYYKEPQALKMSNSGFSNILRALVPDAMSADTKEEREKKKHRRLDPFFIVKFGGVPVNSIDFKDIKRSKGCNDDNVLIQFELPVMEPTYCENIEIEFHDKDITDTDLIGIVRMNYQKTKQQWVKPRWYHIYGAPVGYETNEYATKMNRGLLPGTYYRGQCLMEIKVSKQRRIPPRNCTHFGMDDDRDMTHTTDHSLLNDLDLAMNAFKDMEEAEWQDYHSNYKLCCDIHRGTEMYNIADEMYIEVAIGNSRAHVAVNQKQRKPYRQKDTGLSDTRETWSINETVILLMEDVSGDRRWEQDMRDRYIFVYLCVGKPEEEPDERQRIAYHRIRVKDIFEFNDRDLLIASSDKKNHRPQWYDMREDLVLDKYPDGAFPGSLLIALYCQKIVDPDRKYKILKPVSPLSRDKQKARVEKMYLRADVFFGRNITATDSYSACDAYLQVRFCGKTVRTKRIKDRTDPEWFETVFLDDIEVPDPLEYAPAIYCEVFDDNGASKATPVGRFEQNPNTIQGSKNKLFTLKSSENDEEMDGMVFARFQLSRDKEKINKQPIERPETVPHSVHIVILGLRDVSSVLGVHECSIVFELDGDKYQSRKSHDPEPHNPNFCEIIHFDVLLPDDEAFLPNFNISVVDSVFGGLIERTIGYASKPVSELRRTEQQRVQFLLKHQKTLRNIYKDDASLSQTDGEKKVDAIEEEDLKIEMPADEEHEMLRQAQQSIELSAQKQEKDDEKKQKKDDEKFVYFDVDDNKKAELVPPKKQKWMFTKHGERKIYDDELEDALRKDKDDYPLSPFLDIPIYSVGKNKRNIGTFKGLISFAPKQPKLIVIDIYECKGLKLPKLNAARDSLQPFVVITFNKRELTSSWPAAKQNAELIKRTFKIPVIEPVFADNDEVRIAIWNKTPKKKDKDYVLGYVTYKYSRELAMDGWVFLKNGRKDNIGKILIEIKVETKKASKARVLRMKEPQYIKMQTSERYQREIETEEQHEVSKTDKCCVGHDISMQYIRQITKPKQLYLRVYVLNGIDMTPPDGGSELNDPYLTVSIGDQSQTTKSPDINLFKKDVLPHTHSDVSPDFYESFEFLIAMPGPSSLTIECWDTVIFGIKDDLIGSTCIDIEDRWYDPYWRDYVKPKPIETRTIKLHHMPHGKLKLWVELLTVEEKKKHPKLIDISQPANDPYELRVIIWECKDVPVHDQLEMMNDLFCTASFDDGTYPCQTDLHFRSEAAWQFNPCRKGAQTTDGSFNWRMKFPIHSLRKARKALQHVQIEVWDEDYFSSNEYIGCVRVPLRPFLDVCLSKATKNRCIWRKNDETKLKYTFEKWKTDGSLVETGTLLVTLELVPYKLIDIYPAGNGREAPNTNPHLPDPKGRIKLSLWHPWRSVRLLLGDRLCCKLSVVLLIAIIITAIIQFFPQLFTEFAVTTVMSSRRISSNLIWGN
eukprot:1058238_1